MKKAFLIISLYFLLLMFYGFHVFKEEHKQVPVNNLIVVEISGAVLIPGKYEVSSNATMDKLIYYAKGLLDNANTDNINFQEVLTNGNNYYIPFIKQEKEDDLLININTALKEELMTLSGIGSAKADAIIAYRLTNGYFKNLEDLMLVNGIGQKIYEQIKDKITI